MEKEYTLEELQKMQGEDEGFTFEQLQAMSKDEPLGPVGTFAASAADELALGYGPNILAGLKTGSLSSEDYIAERDRINALLEESEAANPKSGMAGSAAGIVAGLAIPFGGAAKGASLLSKMGRGAALGGAMGAAVDTPDIQGEVTTPQNELEQRAVSGAIGGTIGAAIPMAGELVPDAVNRGFAALGPGKRDALKVLNAEKTGGKMTRENIVNFAKRKGLMKFGDNVEEIYNKTLDQKDITGEELGNLYKRAQEIDLNKRHGGMDSAKAQLIQREGYEQIKNNVVKKISKDLELDKDKDLIINEIGGYFDQIAQNRAIERTIPDILDLHTIKKKLGSYAKYSKNAAKTGSQTPEMEKAWAKAERVVSDEIDKAISTVSGDKKMAQALKQLNEDYSYLMRIEEMVENRVAGDLSVSRYFGIPELINETLQPRINTGLSSVAGGIESVGSKLPLQPQNAPILAPMMMQQRQESPLQRYKSGQ